MADSYIWGNLARATNDPTIIDEAISEAVNAHNDDPDAHLEAGQALQSHRAAEIIDHRAESVVNDKLASASRAYTAIVGTGLEGDFDTIESAINYVDSIGGGVILIESGTHHLSGQVELPSSVSLIGRDADNTFITANVGGGSYLYITNTAVGDQATMNIANITFIGDTDEILKTDPGIDTSGLNIFIRDCYFITSVRLLDLGVGNYLFERCVFNYNVNGIIRTARGVRFYDCTLVMKAGGSTGPVIDLTTDMADDDEFVMYRCYMDNRVSSTRRLTTASRTAYISFYNSDLLGLHFTGTYARINNMINCNVAIMSGQSIYCDAVVRPALISNNRFDPSSGGTIFASNSSTLFVGNDYGGNVSSFGSKFLVANQLDREHLLDLGTTGTVLDFRKYNIILRTITANTTLTATLGANGNMVTVGIRTTDTTSYTVTFGTNMRTQGTLATGTVANRIFYVTFVFYTNMWREISRTGAMLT